MKSRKLQRKGGAPPTDNGGPPPRKRNGPDALTSEPVPSDSQTQEPILNTQEREANDEEPTKTKALTPGQLRLLEHSKKRKERPALRDVSTDDEDYDSPAADDSESSEEPEAQHQVSSKKKRPVLRLKPSEGGPWGWYRKAARKMIRAALDGQSMVASVLGVYDALTELASNDQSDFFWAAHSSIVKHSGFSLSQVKRCLKELKRIGLIKIQAAPPWNPMKPLFTQVCRYMLLEVEDPGSGRLPPSPGLKTGHLDYPQSNTENEALELHQKNLIEESNEESGEEPKQSREESMEKIVCPPGPPGPDRDSTSSLSVSLEGSAVGATPQVPLAPPSKVAGEILDAWYDVTPHGGNRQQDLAAVLHAIERVASRQSKSSDEAATWLLQRTKDHACDYKRRLKKGGLNDAHVPGAQKFFGKAHYDKPIPETTQNIKLNPKKTW